MLISKKWIVEFVELPELSPQEFANKLTMGCAEVDGVHAVGGDLKKITIAKVTRVLNHPQSDKLHLVTFEINSKGETREVVCGAQNVREGLHVAYASVGLTLPCGLKLEPKTIRGVLSEGMLCSEKELGLGEGHEGIMELPATSQIGMDLFSFLKLDEDVLFDIDNKSLTHRPDLWCHYGFSREFATIFSKPLLNKFDEAWAKSLHARIPGGKSPVVPKVSKDSSCLAYFGLSIDGVTVKESPEWIQKRLEALGLRPINNIVDISNYVMLELGIPLHIFDREKISGDSLIIERLGREEIFVTLDEIPRSLKASDTIIRDSKEPLVLAGIMGGLSSGVSSSTKRLFIEVANWKAGEVRKTATRIGLRTDSSSRYEKSLDSLLCERTMLRTLQLVLELCPGASVVGKLEYDGTDLGAIKTLTVKTSARSISKQLGKDVDSETIRKILVSLGFKVEGAEELFITVPSWRATKDVEVEADIVEEIGRIIGFDNITPKSPLWEIKVARFSSARKLQRKVLDYLVLTAKAHEVMTYPLVGKKLLAQADWPVMNEELVLLNDLSPEHDRMRPSLVPSLLEAASLNQRNYSAFRFFELGRHYLPDTKDFSKEQTQLGLVIFDKKRPVFLDLVNTVEGLMNYAGVPWEFAAPDAKNANPAIPWNWSGCHPHDTLGVKAMGRFIGSLTTVHPFCLKEFKISGFLSIAIINLGDVEKQDFKDKTKYRPLAKFPSSTFDCTVVTSKTTPVESVILPLKKMKMKEMDSVKILDVFQSSGEEKWVTVRCVFCDLEKTLSGEFLKNAERCVIESLRDAGFPLKS